MEQDWLEDEPLPVSVVRPPLHVWVRIGLVVIALGLVGLFTIALILDPYKDGKVWTQETHTQLGFPPCTFKVVTRVPCPSCGMSTSFALLIRGDVWNSLQANAAGTLLATICLLCVPWAVVSSVRGRLFGIVAFENLFVRLLVFFLILMLVRWVFVVLFTLYG